MKSSSGLDPQSNILIASFSLWRDGKRTAINGSIEPLLDFFVPRVKRVVLIDQIHPGCREVMPVIEIHEKNKSIIKSSLPKYLFLLYPFLKLTNTSGTRFFFKFRDIISVSDWCLRSKTVYDYFVALECANAFAGIILRRLGFIKKVIYYVSDYAPNRYPGQKLFTHFYLWLDRYCAMHADYIWDVSKAMQPARIRMGLNPQKSAPVLHVPNGLYPSQIRLEDPKNIIPYSLVYMGTLSPDNGPDVAIGALQLLIKKFPQTSLHIIGGGNDDLVRLKNLTTQLHLDKKVKFYGFIPYRDDMSRIVRRCYVGVAPYMAFPDSARWFGDAGKIRTYAASGLPIIASFVPPLGKKVEEKGAAIVVKDNKEDLASAVCKIFSDHKLYMRLRKNAIKFSKDNTWENSFKNAFLLMQKKEENT